MNKPLFLIIFPGLLLALDMHTSIQFALENNLDIKLEEISLSKQRLKLNKAKREEFYPKVEVKETWREAKKIYLEKLRFRNKP